MGFRYKWGGNYPYSFELDSLVDSFNRGEFDVGFSQPTLNEKSKNKLKRVKRIISPPEEFSREVWLESLVTTHYLKNICYVPDFVKGKLEQTLPNYFVYIDEIISFPPRSVSQNRRISLLEFKQIWDRLDEFGLLNKKNNREE